MEWQIRVASGEALPVRDQAEIPLAGHAIEARICAENVARGFLPAAGTLRRMRLPSGVGRGAEGGGRGGGQVKTRVDTGVQEGDTVTVHYDPMVAKVGCVFCFCKKVVAIVAAMKGRGQRKWPGRCEWG